ncbi:C-type mannose receptor 2-like isoform X2 [Acanthopagrus latus]|uniref:C-type mannose receptor 2-like isoform X2 n=1 Tax=Acanthopagrus latus TaxID=8177 RepID=UPI00187CEF9E|nr:C-type mannose receptor 2-like isoform X2 [Acanthopagrus latus]XP_036968023.1 C-type mannose receptor 2-like isoform X2 [Acanthopagrus latus]
MQWSLVLLTLMGQCLFLVWPLHVYYFIDERMTWKNAQSYCRKNYTDLATVYDMNDTQRLSESVRTGEAWIGLHINESQENMVWHWSQPGVEVTECFWDNDQPNNQPINTENCVMINKNNKWHDEKCSVSRAFICYDKEQYNDTYVIHHDKKNWSEAQRHCREKHTDLVSGLVQLQDNNLMSEIQKFEVDFWWIGLFRDSWRWSDGSNASFRNWKSFKDDNSKKCAVTLLPSQKWESRACDQKRPFFCYRGENMILINEPKTWEEAQRYCRENYTDLATVYDMNDTQRLSESVNTDKAWIGLYSVPGKDNRVWHWSQPGVEVTWKEFWAVSQPNDRGGSQNCVAMDRNGWNDRKCCRDFAFICYDEEQYNDTYVIHHDKKNWSEAQRHCRENHTDLVSGLDQLLDKNFRSKIQNHGNSFHWIGLFRDSWRWSDGRNASFRNWKSFKDDDSKKCAVTLLPSQKWESCACNQKRPFFCYREENMILIKKSKTWGEASDYCIQHHRGLVSITDPSQQRWAAEKAKEANTDYVWLGLRYTCVLDLWFWVNDELLCYKNWASGEEPVEGCDRAVAMSRGGGNKWHTKNDTESFNFICALR